MVRIVLNCLNRKNCPFNSKRCRLSKCTEFKEEVCFKLLKPPYVCNGCNIKQKCCLSKHYYEAAYSFNEYKDNLSESRSGVIITKQDIDNLNEILVPLICEQGQSIHQALLNNKNKIMFSDKTIYKFIDLGLLNVKNIDLPRKVRFRNRKKETVIYKIDKNCL